MAETSVATPATPIGKNSVPDSLDAAFAELEHQRRRAVTAWWVTTLALLACLPLLAAPFFLLAWIGSELAPGTLGAELVPLAREWMDPYKDWGALIVFCWPIGGLFGMV